MPLLKKRLLISSSLSSFYMLDFFPSWAIQQNNTDVAAVGQFSYRKWLQLDSNLNMKKKMHNQATYQCQLTS